MFACSVLIINQPSYDCSRMLSWSLTVTSSCIGLHTPFVHPSNHHIDMSASQDRSQLGKYSHKQLLPARQADLPMSYKACAAIISQLQLCNTCLLPMPTTHDLEHNRKVGSAVLQRASCCLPHMQMQEVVCTNLTVHKAMKPWNNKELHTFAAASLDAQNH